MTVETTDFSYNAKSQVVKLSLPEQLSAGSSKAVLTINFSGLLNNKVGDLPGYFCQERLHSNGGAYLDGRFLPQCVQEPGWERRLHVLNSIRVL